ncbi:MAG: putative maltokinase, partial [Chloroflexota bacterium]
EHDEETLLVVANLSRYAQWTELSLDAWEGRVPVELFGSVEFPRIGSDPYLISLGPHSFLWFRLSADPMTEEFSAAGRVDLPQISWRGDLATMAKRGTDEVADVLLRWMLPQRWYRGKANEVQVAKIVDVVPISTASPRAVLVLLRVEYRDVEPVTYVLPLATDDDVDADAILAQAPQAAIARLVGEGGSTRLLDGALVPGVFEALLAIVTGRRHKRSNGTALIGHAVRGLRSQGGPLPETLAAVPLQADASNSSATFSDRLIMKLFRTLEDGPNPDLEVGRFLAERGYAHVPTVLGSVEVAHSSGPDATLAMVQAYVPNEGNLWDATREDVQAYLQDTEAESVLPHIDSDGDTFLLDLSQRAPPERSHLLMGTSMQTARILGERIGQMHGLLASADPADPDFGPETMTPLNVRALYQSIRKGVNDSLELLEARRSLLLPRDQATAARLLDAGPRIEGLLGRLREVNCDGQRIRVHGDLHLGQVLDTGSDVMIIDFEGEPSRPLSARRLKRPALTDLAGMLRSYHYAAHWARLERDLLSGTETHPGDLEAWSTFWYQWVAASCIAGYRLSTEGAVFLPSDDLAWSVLLKSLLVSKACYELRYELGSRPDWVGVPMAGLIDLLGDGIESSS